MLTPAQPPSLRATCPFHPGPGEEQLGQRHGLLPVGLSPNISFMFLRNSGLPRDQGRCRATGQGHQSSEMLTAVRTLDPGMGGLETLVNAVI